jgi:hypothetical protein
MMCHYCGKNCPSLIDGRRVGFHGRVLFLCRSCPPPDPVRSDQECEGAATEAVGVCTEEE